MKIIDLTDQIILKKYSNEDSNESQPLYIDEPDECIKCFWCPSWSGSQEVKWVNQHCKRDKSHQKACMKLMGHSDDSLHGMQDIKDFFVT